MSRRSVRASILVPIATCALALAGCTIGGMHATPFPGYPEAMATNDCGPAGGAATALVLRAEKGDVDAPGARVRVTIWHEFGEVAGRSFTFGDSMPSGSVVEYHADNTNVEYRTWKISFEPA